MNERRDRFRAYMACLDVAVDPKEPLELGYYQETSEPGVGEQLAARAEIEPTSCQLLLGGIGSGKTTELRYAERRLNNYDDILPLYIDVSVKHELRRLTPQILETLVAIELIQHLPEPTPSDLLWRAEYFLSLANGYYGGDYDDYGDGYGGGSAVRVEGILQPPNPLQLDEESRETVSRLSPIVSYFTDVKKRPIVLIDSLDRISDITLFTNAIQNDIKVLSSAGVGVILVGPLHAMYGEQKQLLERFDQVHYLYARDHRTPEGQAFLFQVLRRRVSAEMLPDESAQRLVQWSGGVLRDLLSLAHAAGTHAYTYGAQRVEPRFVERAADAMGRKKLMGMTEGQLKVLQRARVHETFVPTSADDFELLVLGRLIKYSDGEKDSYAIHPTIRPLLEQLSA